ncbi:MAG: PEP-CTERM sorting domain-containing protein [Akkermansia sp.]|nr:PEP-CTERM sorting domain-containing protein [Akkermansia sp.]
MKKTLFAMAALALMGGQAFGVTYTTSMSSLISSQATSFTSDVYGKGADVIFSVDSDEKFNYIFDATESSSLTLSFVGEHVLSTKNFYPKSQGTVDITGNQAAVTHWETLLTASSDYAYIQLVTASFATCPTDWPLVTFMQTSANNNLTLGNSLVKYVGYTKVSSITGLQEYGSGLGDNEVALVGLNSSASRGLYIVGKATSSPVPEPATATLSLLALAGLATRRRRK